MKLGTRNNQCAGCLQGFGSMGAFEAHRVGPFGTGPKGTSPDRKCLTVDEMSSLGWKRDLRGFWHTEAPEGRPNHWNAGNGLVQPVEPAF